MGAMATVIKDANEAQRKKILADLLGIYKDTGNKSWTVTLPSGDKVATFTIAEPKPGHKVNNDELLAWCRSNRADLVETLSHPAVPAWTEYRLRGDVEKVITSEYKLAGDTYITDDGEPVAGVEYVPAGTPKSFTVRYAPGGQERIIEAWRGGELAGIEPGKNLPMIGG
jgi:hypothetical protein